MDHPVDYEISDEVHWYWFNMDWVGALKAWLKIKKDELEYIKEKFKGPLIWNNLDRNKNVS